MYQVSCPMVLSTNSLPSFHKPSSIGYQDQTNLKIKWHELIYPTLPHQINNFEYVLKVCIEIDEDYSHHELIVNWYATMIQMQRQKSLNFVDFQHVQNGRIGIKDPQKITTAIALLLRRCYESFFEC